MDELLAGYRNANELCIQLISLATGILVLSITFINDVLKRKPRTWALKASWACFLISIVFGIQMMMAITGDIFKLTRNKEVIRAVLYKSDPDKIKAMMSEADAADPAKVNAVMEEAVSLMVVDYKENVMIPSMLQIFTFVGGIIFLIIFGRRTMTVSPRPVRGKRRGRRAKPLPWYRRAIFVLFTWVKKLRR